MDIVKKILLIIPLFLIRVGELTRSTIFSSFQILTRAYNLINKTIKKLFQLVIKQILITEKYLFQKNIKYQQQLKQANKFTQNWQIKKKLLLFLKFIIGCFFNISKYLKPKFSYPKKTQSVLKIPKLKKRETDITPTSSNRYPVPLLVSWRLRSFFAGIFVSVFFIFIPFYSYQMLKSLPNPYLLSRRDLEVATKIYDRNGILLYEIYADQNRTPINLETIPDIVKQATISIEDKNFYNHKGFSPSGIIRSIRETIINKNIQGGSTITQQLIKSALLSPEITITRKIKEIILAFWAEQMYTKNQILEMYLNQVPYGGTTWGIESASRNYFNKPASDLSLAEAALLAGLPAAPTEFSPFGSNPYKAKQRQVEVLRRMKEDGFISDNQINQALEEQLSYATPLTGIKAPHFVMYVKDILEKKYGSRIVERGGLRVVTSLDITIQNKAESIVKNQIQVLSPLSVGNGASLITNPKNGEILAMVGSKDYFDLASDGNVNVTTSLRQPGSSIKVVNYAAAMENGFTAATIIKDAPVAYRINGSPDYIPVNYDGRFHGFVPLRYALANSYNIPAVKVLAKIGVKTMIEKGKSMGITSWEDDSRFGLSLALGGGDVTMLDMAKVYGTLAAGGISQNLKPILKITDYTGKEIENNYDNLLTPKNQSITPQIAWIISNILSDNKARSAAFGTNSLLVIPNKTVSVKTGTSNDKRDNWAIGYTPSYVVVVWVGNNDNSPMNHHLTSGITGATPIWHDIMIELLKDKDDEITPMPKGIVQINCHYGRKEFFVKGAEPISGICKRIPKKTTPTPVPTIPSL
ncbi:transglycosylase domain-containing protein [Patescibacteria group bacterium]